MPAAAQTLDEFYGVIIRMPLEDIGITDWDKQEDNTHWLVRVIGCSLPVEMDFWVKLDKTCVWTAEEMAREIRAAVERALPPVHLRPPERTTGRGGR